MGNFSYGLKAKIIVKATAGWVIKDHSSLTEISLEEKGPKILRVLVTIGGEIIGDLKMKNGLLYIFLGFANLIQ